MTILRQKNNRLNRLHNKFKRLFFLILFAIFSHFICKATFLSNMIAPFLRKRNYLFWGRNENCNILIQYYKTEIICRIQMQDALLRNASGAFFLQRESTAGVGSLQGVALFAAAAEGERRRFSAESRRRLSSACKKRHVQ